MLSVTSKQPQSKSSSRAQAPPSALSFLVVVCGVVDAVWSDMVECSVGDTVEDLRRRSERAAGLRPSRSSYLLVESQRKPLRDHLCVVGDYGLDGSQRLVLVTDRSARRVRGGASDVDALLAMLRTVKGLEKLDGWKDLANHRDASKCKGIKVEGGRVIRLDICYSNLSGSLPVEIGELMALTYFGVHGNKLTGKHFQRIYCSRQHTSRYVLFRNSDLIAWFVCIWC